MLKNMMMDDLNHISEQQSKMLLILHKLEILGYIMQTLVM